MRNIKILLVLLLIFSINVSSGMEIYPDSDKSYLELNSPYITEYPFSESLFLETNKAFIEQSILNEMYPIEVETNKEAWEVNGLYFDSNLKNSISDDETWSYIENDKNIAFTYEEIQWNNEQFISSLNPSIGEIDTESSSISLTYPDAISDGIDIKIIQDNYQWQKIVEIESLTSLGNIPVDAEYLEISFKVSGDFTLPEGTITDPIPIGENSFIQPVQAWDASGDYSRNVNGIVAGNIITKQIPVEWLKSASYPVQTDLIITYGAEYVFNEASSHFYISVAALDSTHFVVVYKDMGNLEYGTAIIGTVSGNTISYGSEYVFNSASTSQIYTAALDSTHFVIMYQNIAMIGEVSSGNVITYGSKYVFAPVFSYEESFAVLDNTHFVVGYKEPETGYISAIIGVISGTEISYGPKNTLPNTGPSCLSVAALDSTHFVIAFFDTSMGLNSYGIVGEVSGGNVTSFGSSSVFSNSALSSISVAALDSTHFVIAYGDAMVSQGIGIIGSVTGTNIDSYSTENAFNMGTANKVSVAALDSTHFIVSYIDAGNSYYGTTIAGEVSGGTISYGAEYIFNEASTEIPCISSLDSTYFVVAYQDAGNLDYGTAIVGLALPNTAPVTSSLKTESQTNPTQVHTNTSAPYFTWTYSDANSDTQTHWEIYVGTSPGTSNMWDSTQLSGTDTSDIYAGSSLSRGTTYYVQVRTNDGIVWSNWATGTFKINELPVFTDDIITPSIVTKGETFTVNVDVTDSDGTIVDAIVKIDDINYSMANTVGDTWSYDYLNAALGTYYITDFYAQDNSGEWSSTFSALNITVISADVAAFYSTTYNEPIVVETEDRVKIGKIDNFIDKISEGFEEFAIFIRENALLILFIIGVLGLAAYAILESSKK